MRRAALLLSCLACRAPGSGTASASASASAATASAAAPAPAAASASDSAPAPAAASAAASASGPAARPVGPFELPFDGKRLVYFVAPERAGRARLMANLHGVCNPPGYACGYWVNAASKTGFLVCPEGNSRCGPGGPPTWTAPATKMDDDLEKAIAVVDARYPGEIDRAGAVLTGFSLGAYVAYQIARAHPGRWPYLVLTEADVPLDAAALRAAGVRAVALVDGERGSQIAGARRTAERLSRQGFPARLWVMKDAGHHYSADIDDIMAEAIAFVTSVTGEADASAPR